MQEFDPELEANGYLRREASRHPVVSMFRGESWSQTSRSLTETKAVQTEF